ncbi:hypothetical protein MMC34_001174 [Xylographa carneopallida]|nr:hypothetical protein [Xylographa carneopallida]
MTDPRTPRSLGRSVVRYHSPYCEATGPIVEEGTVAARIQALQNAAKDNLDIIRSHTPVTPTPPCKLIPEWRPRSALGSSTPDQQSSPNPRTQLADYILNESPQHSEHMVPGIVRNQTLAFSTSALRRKSATVLGQRSKTPSDAERPKSTALQSPTAASSPRLSRETSWKQTIKQNVAARSGKSVGNQTGSPESTTSEPKAANGYQDALWPNNRPMLRKVSTDHSSTVAKPYRQNMSIAEQIGEMIDRALQGRDDTTGTITPQSSVPELAEERGQIPTGKLDHSHFARFATQKTEALAGSSPGSKQANMAQDPIMPRSPEVGLEDNETRSYNSRRYDGRYSSTDANHLSRDGPDTEKYFISKPAVKPQFETPTHHPRPRACTYTSTRPLNPDVQEHVPNAVRRRSISSPMSSSQERLLCSNDRYEVFVREMHQHESKSSCRTHSTIPKDKPRRPSLRKYAATAPRPPLQRSYNQSQGQMSSHKRWKWWKLVMVDKEPSHGEQAHTEGEPKETSTWGPAVHPLAAYGHYDAGHGPSHLVERLERACTEREYLERDPPSTEPQFVRATKSSARTTHTLAQCGHEDDEDLEPLDLSGDGSWDVFRSTTTSASGTITHRSVGKPQMQVKITSKGLGTRVQVRTGKSRGGEKRKLTRSTRDMKVLVQLQEDHDSVVRVVISPKRK